MKLMGNVAAVLELGPRRAQSELHSTSEHLSTEGVVRGVSKRWLEKPFRLR